MLDVGAVSSRMTPASYGEARWNRVLVQSGWGLATYAMVLVATRLWTSFSFTISMFQKRRQKSPLDAVFAVVDILCSVGSQCCFVAYSHLREHNKYLVRVRRPPSCPPPRAYPLTH